LQYEQNPTHEQARWPEWLTIATAAQYLDCSEGLVRKLLTAPDPIPSVSLGRARRIPRVSLDAFLARRMAGPVAVDDLLEEIRRHRWRDDKPEEQRV